MNLRLAAIEGLPNIAPGDDLAALIAERPDVGALQDGDVIVISQKIVSKAEDCYVRLDDAVVDERARTLADACGKDPRFVATVLSETERVVRIGPNLLIVRNRLGLVMANAGIDQSNIDRAEDRVLLLPQDPDRSAREIRARLKELTGRSVGIVIADSSGRAWRTGVVGLCIGCAGVVAIEDRRGDIDRFGNELKVTVVAVADMLASAASLLLGEGAEGVPAVMVSGIDRRWLAEDSVSARDLVRPVEQDLFL